MTTLSSLVLLLAGGLGTGLSAAITLGDTGFVGSGRTACVAYLPALLVGLSDGAVLLAVAAGRSNVWLCSSWACRSGCSGSTEGGPSLRNIDN